MYVRYIYRDMLKVDTIPISNVKPTPIRNKVVYRFFFSLQQISLIESKPYCNEIFILSVMCKWGETIYNQIFCRKIVDTCHIKLFKNAYD